MKKPLYASSHRLSPVAHRLLQRLAASLGVTQTAVLELAIREYAQAKLSHASREAWLAGVMTADEED